MNTIVIENVTKQYGNTLAIDNVNLVLDKAKIYGLLGRNGVGKSTLINIITNRIFATTGCVMIDGENVCENDSALQKIFCTSEKSGYPSEMRVKKAFTYAKGYYPDFDVDYANKLARMFKLDISKRIGALSTGFNSIYKIILTLASNAPICIYDEPALGLDATVRDKFYKELVKNFKQNPRIVILSTHIIEEVSDILEHVIIIDNGKIIVDKSVGVLLGNNKTSRSKLQKIFVELTAGGDDAFQE